MSKGYYIVDGSGLVIGLIETEGEIIRDDYKKTNDVDPTAMNKVHTPNGFIDRPLTAARNDAIIRLKRKMRRELDIERYASDEAVDDDDERNDNKSTEQDKARSRRKVIRSNYMSAVSNVSTMGKVTDIDMVAR